MASPQIRNRGLLGLGVVDVKDSDLATLVLTSGALAVRQVSTVGRPGRHALRHIFGVGELTQPRPVGVDHPQVEVVGPTARGDERDPGAVRGPHRTRLGALTAGELHPVSAGLGHQPQVELLTGT